LRISENYDNNIPYFEDHNITNIKTNDIIYKILNIFNDFKQ